MSDVALVTGASGFLGAYVCRALRKRRYEVRGTVRRAKTTEAWVDAFPLSDLEDRSGLLAACTGAAAVVHLAARVHQMRDPASDSVAAYRRINVEGTRAVLDAAVACGVRKFVFVSSVKAVGESNSEPWEDDVTPSPVDPYGISKLEAERLVLAHAARNGIEAIVLRLPLCYGAGVKGNMRLLFRLLDLGVPLPLGGVRNSRSLAYAGNVAWAIAEALARGELAGRTFFLSDGEDLSTPELVRRIARALGRPARLLPFPHSALVAAGRLGDVCAKLGPFPVTSEVVRRLVLSLAVNSTGFARLAGPMPFSVEAGLAETAVSYRGSWRS